MKIFKVILLLFFPIAILCLYNSFYTISEYEQAAIIQLGEPLGSAKDPGLHVKMPFIQKVVKYEKRMLRWSGERKEVPTKDGILVYVDATAGWMVDDPMKFFQTVGTYDQAYTKLDDIIDSVVKDHVAANTLIELVRGQVAADQSAVNSSQVSAFGIRLEDIRLIHLDVGQKVLAKIYERMISEQKSKAAQLISEGEGKKAEVTGLIQKDLQAITSGAFKAAQEIKGKADAEAAKIYGKTYNQDSDFYSFYKTLETYKETSFENTTLILGTDSDFYTLLKGPSK